MIIRTINFSDDLSLKVFNIGEGVEKLAQEAIFIFPCDRPTDALDPRYRRDHIVVMYGGVVGTLNSDKNGTLVSGTELCAETLKIVEVYSDRDVKTQVQGYLALLRLTKDKVKDIYTSVVVVNNPKNLAFDNLHMLGLLAYKSVYVKENEEALQQQRERVEKDVRKSYSLLSLDGIRRRVLDKTMTSYFGARDEWLRFAGEFTHGNKEPAYIGNISPR